MVKYVQGQAYLCTDNDFLNLLYKQSGMPGKPMKPENIRWIPFKLKW